MCQQLLGHCVANKRNTGKVCALHRHQLRKSLSIDVAGLVVLCKVGCDLGSNPDLSHYRAFAPTPGENISQGLKVSCLISNLLTVNAAIHRCMSFVADTGSISSI